MSWAEVNTAVSALKVTVEALTEGQVETLRSRINELGKETQTLDSDIKKITGDFASQVEEFKGQIKRETEESISVISQTPTGVFEDAKRKLASAIGPLNHVLQDGNGEINQFLDEVRVLVRHSEESRKLKSVAEEVFESFERQLEEIASLVEEIWEERLPEAVEESLDSVLEFGSNVGDSCSEAVGEAIAQATDSVESEIQERVDALGSALIEIVVEEVMEAQLTATLSQQLAATLAPYQPQLMVLRESAPAIKSALQTIRAGL